MERNKRHFLDFLNGIPTANVIFEPFICKDHSENIIWRRGKRLWSTPREYINTLASVAERTESGFFYCDMRSFNAAEKKELIDGLRIYKNSENALGIGVICDTQDDANTAKEVADCLCLFGKIIVDGIPIIRMDGNIEEAILRGDTGWFAYDNAVWYLENYGDRIKILGGLGVDFIKSSSPVRIYSAVGEIAAKYRGKWACGSGGSIPSENYYELASMFGAFARIKENI